MTLCNHSSRIYMDDEDVGGLLNVLSRRINESTNAHERDVHTGAHLAINLLRNHTFRTQAEFMAVFDGQLEGKWDID